jgi:hypothetical protein
MTLTEADRDALTLAIEVTRRESPGRRQQIDSFLSSRPWDDVATFAASCAQSRALDLPPWQPPPCHIGDVASALNDTDEHSEVVGRLQAGCGTGRKREGDAGFSGHLSLLGFARTTAVILLR